MHRSLCRVGVLLALAAALGPAPAWGQDAKDPEVALKELNTWYQEEFAKLTPTSPTTARQELLKQRTDRAKAAVKDVDPEKADPAKSYALAQLFQIAQETPKVAVSARRYLSSNPTDAQSKFNAQNMVLADLAGKSDAEGIVALVADMKPPTPLQAGSLAMMTGLRYASIVAEKKGAQAGLDFVGKVEALIPFDEMLKKPDVTGRTGQLQAAPERSSAESAIMYLAQARSSILDDAGKTDEALAALEAAGKKLPPTSSGITTLAQRRASLLEKKGKIDQALAVLVEAEKGLPEGSTSLVSLAQTRASILEKAGKKDEAVVVLETAAAKFPTGSPARKALDSKIKLAKIVGTPAPALKQDRGYGNFKSLDDYKGKVVVVEFTAHW